MPQKAIKKTAKNKAQTKQKNCIACDNSKFVEYTSELEKCISCGLIVAKHIPTFDELKKLYEQEYFFGMEYSDYKADRLALEKNFRVRTRFLKPYLHKKSRVVEVGCAYGYFLNMIQDEVAWHKGYDVSEEGIDYAKKELNLNAHSGDFLDDKTVKSDSVDLVCMWDVVEHLGEPEKYIKKSSNLLKKGGALCLTTGNIGAFVPRKRGEKWRMIHPPTHIYYFDTDSITKLLERYGLKVTSIRHKATYRNTGSVFNQLIVNRKAQNKNAKVLEVGYKVAQKTGLHKLNIPLNLYDVMEVTAIKL